MNYRAEFLHYELQESPPFGRRVDISAVMQVPSRGTERTSWDSVHGVSCGAPNVLTLSCKTRLTGLPQEAARRRPRLTRSGRSEVQPACRARAVRAARGGSDRKSGGEGKRG